MGKCKPDVGELNKPSNDGGNSTATALETSDGSQITKNLFQCFNG